MSTYSITLLLGGPEVVGEMRSPIEIARAVRVGLPWAAFEAMGAALAIPARQLAAMLHIPPRTLSRRKDAGKLEAMESDRLCRLARVVAHAVEVDDVLGRIEHGIFS